MQFSDTKADENMTLTLTLTLQLINRRSNQKANWSRTTQIGYEKSSQSWNSQSDVKFSLSLMYNSMDFFKQQ